MQAIVEKNLESNPGLMPEDTQLLKAEESDYEYVQDVVESCSSILQIFQEYVEQERLVQLPSRVIYRIFTSSILLLKALSIGVRQTQFETSLNILKSSIQALTSHSLDDLHCVPRYAALLDMQLKRLRSYFAESLRYPTSAPTGLVRALTTSTSAQSTRDAGDFQMADLAEPNLESDLVWPEMALDNWLRLPFDPSMAPFDLTGPQAQTGLDLSGLEFIWNVPNS